MATAIRCASAVVVVAAMFTLPAVARAGGVIPISACGTLSSPGTVYTLTRDIASACDDSCLLIAADRIAVDLQGHTVTSGCALDGVGIAGDGRDAIVARNGTVTGFATGLGFVNTTRLQRAGHHGDRRYGWYRGRAWRPGVRSPITTEPAARSARIP